MSTIIEPKSESMRMIREIREKIFEDTKNMTHDEFRVLLQRHSESFEKKIEKARAERLAKQER